MLCSDVLCFLTYYAILALQVKLGWLICQAVVHECNLNDHYTKQTVLNNRCLWISEMLKISKVFVGFCGKNFLT